MNASTALLALSVWGGFVPEPWTPKLCSNACEIAFAPLGVLAYEVGELETWVAIGFAPKRPIAAELG